MIDKDRSKTLTIISLGAGVQSSAMALMAAKGELPTPNYCIFADTGFESKSCYLYLDLLEKILPFPIIRVSAGNIKDDLKNYINESKRMPNAPFFTKEKATGKKGMLRRQCTDGYKIQPIRQKIRQLSGVKKGKHFPKDKYVEQWIGISTDEIQRMKPARDKYILNRHPLIEMKMSRQDCINWMKKNEFPLPEKSACIFCPYHNDNFWYEMKKNNRSEFNEAVEIDKFIRKGNDKLTSELYLHRSLKPLDEVEFNKKETDKQLDMFNNECEGMCGV